MMLRSGAAIALAIGCGGVASTDGGVDASEELDAAPADAGKDASYGCPLSFECAPGFRCSESTGRCLPCDEDGDGYDSPECTDTEADCDDSNESVHPGAPVVCANGILDACADGLDDGLRAMFALDEASLVAQRPMHTIPPGWTLVPEISFALTPARAWLAVADDDGVRTHGAVTVMMLESQAIEGHFLLDGLVRVPFHPSSMAVRSTDAPESVWFAALGDAPDIGYELVRGVLETGGDFALSIERGIDGNPNSGRAAVVGGGSRADGSRVEPIAVHRTQYVGRWHHTNWRIEDGRILYSNTYSPLETDGLAWMDVASSSGAHAVFQSDAPPSVFVMWDTLGGPDDVWLIDVTYAAAPATVSLAYLGGERYALSYAVEPNGVAVAEVSCTPSCVAGVPHLVETSREYADTSLAELPGGVALAAVDAASGQVVLWALDGTLETAGGERVLGAVDPSRVLGDLALASSFGVDRIDLFVAASEVGDGAEVWISGLRGCVRR